MKNVILPLFLSIFISFNLSAQNYVRPEHQHFFEDKYQFSASIVQPDGKIILAGQVESIEGIDIIVMRFWPDGKFDNDFGIEGKTGIDIEASSDLVNDMALQADGKIVLVGQNGDYPQARISVIRLTKDGHLDRSFGNEGWSIHKVGSICMANAIAIDNNQNIVVAGLSKSGGYHGTTLLRFLPNGHLDASFGKAGVSVFAATQYDDEVTDLLLQNNGDILVAGKKNILQFAVDGKFNQILHDIKGGVAMASLDNDAFLVASTYFEAQKLGFQVARYQADGSLDKSFGKDGIVRHAIAIDFDASVSAISLQEDGKIILGGQVDSSEDMPESDIALLRLLANGEVDTDFGKDGVILTELTAEDEALKTVVAHPNGSLLLLGSSWGTDLSSIFGILRLKDSTLR